MFKTKSTRKTLLVIAGLAVFLLACGLIDQVMEQIGPAEALVEELVTELEETVGELEIDDEPVDTDQPTVIEDPGDSELPAEFARYPGAEFFSITDAGDNRFVHRYLTNDSMEDVLAFYESEYPYLIFEDTDACKIRWDVSEDGMDLFIEEFIETGIDSLWICRTSEAYFESAPFFGDTYITEEDLELLPENMTVIEIGVWEGN